MRSCIAELAGRPRVEKFDAKADFICSLSEGLAKGKQLNGLSFELGCMSLSCFDGFHERIPALAGP